MADLVTSLKHLLGAKEDGVVATAAGAMAQLYADASCGGVESSVGSEGGATYRHLPETSILRALVQLLTDVTKSHDVKQQVDANVINIAMTSLTRGSRQLPLPPLNWAQLLAPVVRLQLNYDVERTCLQLALQLARSSTSACKFVTSWTKPAQFESLSPTSQHFMLTSLPLLVKSLSSAHLSEFVTGHLLPKFMTSQTSESGNLKAEVEYLQSLLDALRVPDPPRGVTLVLEEALSNLCFADVIVSNVNLPTSVQTDHIILMMIMFCCCGF